MAERGIIDHIYLHLHLIIFSVGESKAWEKSIKGPETSDGGCPGNATNSHSLSSAATSPFKASSLKTHMGKRG